MYKKECEYLTTEPVVLRDNLKRIEYWIPQSPQSPHQATFACGFGNVISNPEGRDLEYGEGVKMGKYFTIETFDGSAPHPEQDYHSLMGHIKMAREAAEFYNVPFEVKSCFPLLHAKGFHEYIELTTENLKKLTQGEIPESMYIRDTKDYNCMCPAA